MELFERIVTTLEYYIWSWGIPVGGESIPPVVIALIGTGVFLTLRLGFIQVRRLGHGFAVTSGRYDDPEEPGDVSHFQALTTALSATVGIGNIAGVAIAIHWGGPGALFWMWITALLGMATKFTEVTLAQRYRTVDHAGEGHRWESMVSGGPMYYIERGLGAGWKPLAVFFAVMLIVTSFLTGNGVQANTVADTMLDEFGVPVWATGLFTATLVALVILGGIRRIGRVTAILAPLMAAVYAVGALIIILIHVGDLPSTLGLIFREAFQPTAGVAGTGVGVFLVTLMWGVRRGLFSNEAGQGSAPIAHAAAKTDEPVSEGVVALLEPFIDTIVICSLTGLSILLTGVWSETIPTRLDLGSGDVSYVQLSEGGAVERSSALQEIRVDAGRAEGPLRFAWHEVEVERFFVDEARTVPFTGVIRPETKEAVGDDGTTYASLHGLAVESGAPLTKLAFERALGPMGRYIVAFSVFLFAISTAISWSYYGDRCANYLFGAGAILPYKLIYVAMHFAGALLALATVWTLGDVALGLVVLPNLLALILLSGRVREMVSSYFERRPWEENAVAHQRWKESQRGGKQG